jgi:hypothetical protein
MVAIIATLIGEAEQGLLPDRVVHPARAAIGEHCRGCRDEPARTRAFLPRPRR